MPVSIVVFFAISPKRSWKDLGQMPCPAARDRDLPVGCAWYWLIEAPASIFHPDCPTKTSKTRRTHGENRRDASENGLASSCRRPRRTRARSFRGLLTITLGRATTPRPRRNSSAQRRPKTTPFPWLFQGCPLRAQEGKTPRGIAQVTPASGAPLAPRAPASAQPWRPSTALRAPRFQAALAWPGGAAKRRSQNSSWRSAEDVKKRTSGT